VAGVPSGDPAAAQRHGTTLMRQARQRSTSGAAQNSFPAYVHRDEQLRVREGGRYAVQSPKSGASAREDRGELTLDPQL